MTRWPLEENETDTVIVEQARHYHSDESDDQPYDEGSGESHDHACLPLRTGTTATPLCRSCVALAPHLCRT